jgi:hypothetical protein
MVRVALWLARSPRLSTPSNNPPGVKLYLPCSRPLATNYCLPGGTCSLFESPLRADPTPTKHRFVVTPSSMAANGSNDDDDATLGQQHHVAQQQHQAAWCMLGDNDANLGDNATPLGARLVTTMPSLKTLGNITKLGKDSTLCDNNATLGNNATPLGDNTKLVTRTLQRHAWQRCHVTYGT